MKQLQKERAETREQNLKDATKIRNLKKALNESWQPESDGFEFSTVDLAAWIARRMLPLRAFWHH